MFWKKKAEADSPSMRQPRSATSLDSPRPVPILKAQPDHGAGGPSIRFARSVSGSPAASSAGVAPAVAQPGRAVTQVQPQSLPQERVQHQVQPQRSPQRVPIQAPVARQAVPRIAIPQPYAPRPPQPVREHAFHQSEIQPVAPATSVPAPVAAAAAAHPAVQRVQGARKSSRPTSPSSSSFGSRLPLVQAARPGASSPLTTPPLAPASHVTTPPTAYVSSMQNRAPPPPSPYRPTSERRTIAPLPNDGGGRPPPRGSSLFETPNAPGRSPTSATMSTGGGLTPRVPGLPTFNLIPATPQTAGEAFFVRRSASADGSVGLEGAFGMDSMVDVPLEPSTSAPALISSIDLRGQFGAVGTYSEEPDAQEELATGDLPSLDSLPAIGQLEFSPFEVLASLPSSGSGSSISSLPYSIGGDDSRCGTASAPLPCVPVLASDAAVLSPPSDETCHSLPSLESEPSLHSSSSQGSIRSSGSTSSLASYSDVEEALGSMLASLSDPSMPRIPTMTKLERSVGRSNSNASSMDSHTSLAESPSSSGMASNPGLGLGLALPASSSITAPLAPRRRQPPPPLDLTLARNPALQLPDQASAPARINHRVAFYTTARAHPNSPSSGVFTHHHVSNPDLAHLLNGPSGVTSPPRSESDSVLSLSSDDMDSAGSNRMYNNQRTSIRASLRDSTGTAKFRQSLVGQGQGPRDSVMSSFSIGSEASDEDLHTASIVCLTPVVGGTGKGLMVGLGLAGIELGAAQVLRGGEECLVESGYGSEVGLAL